MSNRSFQPSGSKISHAGVFLLLLLSAFVFAPSAHANSSLFINSNYCSGWCGSAQFFGVLVGPSDALSLNVGNTTTNYLNDFGISAGATVTTTVSSGKTINIGSSTVASVVDFSLSSGQTMTDSARPCTNAGCTVPSTSGSSFNSAGTTKIWGGTHANDVPNVDVTTAYSQFTSMYNYWSGQTSGAGTPTQTGTWNIGATGGVHVFTAANWNTSSALTITCGASACPTNDLIIVIVPGTFIANANISFAAASGLTDDQLLFVIENSGNTALQLSTTTNATIHGDFLVDGGYAIGTATRTATVDGRIFAGLAAGSQSLVWNGASNLANEPDAPEPSTWLMMIGGIGGCVWLQRRRRRNQA